MLKTDEFIITMAEKADEYIDMCIASKKEVATGSGKIVEVKDRHIPTISYFLNIWLPKELGETINRRTYSRWLESEDELRSKTIKEIDEKFKALAGDIVANEGKGIFYAKNKLGWSDRQQTETSLTVTGLPIQINSNAPPLANDDK